MNILGSIALFFTVYNIACGWLHRFNGNSDDARQAGVEASIWFVAAVICFK